MKKQFSMVLASGLLASTALAPAALAQDAAAEGDQVQSVYERYRPDYDAPGIRSGSFLFYPAIAATGKYDSNIFAKESDKIVDGVSDDGVRDDFIAIIKPSFALVSDWNSDFLQLFADAAIGRYASESSENYEDFNVGARGRKDISHGTDIHADVLYTDGHEDRGSPDANGAQVEPTKFSSFDAKLGFKRDVSVLSFALDLGYTRKNFDDVAIYQKDPVTGKLEPTGVLNNDDRDRDRTKVDVRLGYEMSDGYEAFVRTSMDRVEYDNSKEDGGPQRNSDGYEAVAGAAFDLTGKARGEVYVGYMKRAYDSDTMGSTDGINFGAELLWNVSGLTSFTGSIKRGIGETTVGGRDAGGTFTQSSGIVSTQFFGRVEHELRRNVLLSADASYVKQSFQLTTREDDLLNFKVGAKYLVNRNMNVNVGYNYGYRDTTEQGQDYSRHALMVNVKAQW